MKLKRPTIFGFSELEKNHSNERVRNLYPGNTSILYRAKFMK